MHRISHEEAASKTPDSSVDTTRSQLKQGNRVWIDIDIRAVKRTTDSIDRYHIRCADRTQTVDVNI